MEFLVEHYDEIFPVDLTWSHYLEDLKQYMNTEDKTTSNGEVTRQSTVTKKPSGRARPWSGMYTALTADVEQPVWQH